MIMRVFWLLWLSFASFFCLVTSQEEVIAQYDYEYNSDYPDCSSLDECNFYDHECSAMCHHNHFPNSTLESKFGAKVSKCCGFHGYIYTDNCDARRPQLFGKKVCGRKNHEPELVTASRLCPTFCKLISSSTLRGAQNFTINPATGVLSLAALIGGRVENYCVSYECLDDAWAIGLEVCVCSDDELLQTLSQPFERAKKCCPTSWLSDYSKTEIGCPKNIPEENFKCANGKIVEYSSIEIDGDTIIGRHFNNEIKKTIQDENYCIGSTIENTLKGEAIKMKLYVCEAPCNGNEPCIRTCCEPGKLEATCDDPPGNASFLAGNSQISNLLGDDEKQILQHLMKADSAERICTPGKSRMPYLNPKERCNDKFELQREKNQVVLFSSLLGKTFNQNEFCLNVLEGNFLSAEVCRESITRHKFKFYPYILMISCFFLLVTLVVYTIYTKLLTHYTRIMRHFTFTMLVAFAVLSINQLESFKEKAIELCIFFGYVEQYMFLVSFTLMTAMSVEVWMQTSGNQTSNKRYMLEILAGYGFPLVVTICTILVETLAERCSDFRPRFGEEQCFFTSILAKGIWFYLPIGLLLLVNSVMFATIVVRICKIDRNNRQLNLRSGNRSDSMERFLLFLKLFLGMGFIWTFEIFAGLFHDQLPESTWYVTDVLNMLQGFYIFAIFVCKRNVLNEIFKGRDGMSAQSRSNGARIPLMPLKTKRKEIMSTSGCGPTNSTHVTET